MRFSGVVKGAPRRTSGNFFGRGALPRETFFARLVQRTTRKLSLTDAGRVFYEHCSRIVSAAEDAERAVTSLQEKPRGRLRVTTTTNSAAFLGPIVRDYLKRYPDVRLEMLCTQRSVDLVEERFDLAIRAGQLPDSTLIARSLGRVSWFLVATPAYLKRRGRPRSPSDLRDHDWLWFGSGNDRAALRLERGGESASLDLSPRLVVSDIEIVHAVVGAGLGIALVPAYQCLADLRERRLERVLREWGPPVTPVHIVYPSARHLVPAVKSFIDYVQRAMTPPAWGIGP
jgi:DNA-binding transcriptional LysR family regulator